MNPPAGFTARPITPADAPVLHRIGIARDIADTGGPDWTLADVEAELATPGLDLERHSLLVAGEDDAEAVAFAALAAPDARVVVHPCAEGHGIGSWLASEVERWGRAAGADELRQELATGNAAGEALLERNGYTATQRYWRMARELRGDEPPARPPDGVALRTFGRGADDRAAYDLIADAFRDIPGNTERSFEWWAPRALGPALDPELSSVAEDVSGPVGLTLCERYEESTGHVAYVAVARRGRGRGIGRALLGQALHLFAAAGLERGMLWVNGRNDSATRLYRSVGMKQEQSAVRWAKPLRSRVGAGSA